MLDMKETGLTLRTMSITYTTTVGNEEACMGHKIVEHNYSMAMTQSQECALYSTILGHHVVSLIRTPH